MLRPWEAAVLSSSRSPGHLLRLGACLWEQRDIPSKEAQMIHFSKIGRLSADPRAQVSWHGLGVWSKEQGICCFQSPYLFKTTTDGPKGSIAEILEILLHVSLSLFLSPLPPIKVFLLLLWLGNISCCHHQHYYTQMLLVKQNGMSFVPLLIVFNKFCSFDWWKQFCQWLCSSPTWMHFK